ncbi:unnamed protein product, partial [Mesorhabditis spiculigera]
MELNTGKKARVITAMRQAKQHLFNYQGYIGAYLLIGGVDPTGPHLYECTANGTTMHKEFAAQGSGSYAAISILERDFKPKMTEAEAKDLVQRALHAGMHGDNASGNSLNLVIIRPEKTIFEGPIVPEFCKKPEPIDLDYKFKAGSTAVLKRKEIKYEIVESMDDDVSQQVRHIRTSIIPNLRKARFSQAKVFRDLQEKINVQGSLCQQLEDDQNAREAALRKLTTDEIEAKEMLEQVLGKREAEKSADDSLRRGISDDCEYLVESTSEMAVKQIAAMEKQLSAREHGCLVDVRDDGVNVVGLHPGLQQLTHISHYDENGDEIMDLPDRLMNQDRVNALILVNCVHSTCGWVEWGYEKVNQRHLKNYGMTSFVADYLMWHHFGRRIDECSSDIVRQYRVYFQHLPNPTNLSMLIDAYINRTPINFSREGGAAGPQLRVPVLQLVGAGSAFVNETVEVNTRLDPSKSDWIKVSGSCGLVLDDRPEAVTEALMLFLQGLGYFPTMNVVKLMKQIHEAQSGSYAAEQRCVDEC